jgi:hypothetical protein
MQTCQRTPNLVQIEQKNRVRFVADDINSPQKHVCATLNISVLLTVTLISKIKMQCTVAFPLQQWLCKRATI